jgi:hypothetical protein
VFLGYSPDHKGHRCFDLTSCRVLISRHVVFDESDFPYSTSHTPSPDPESASPFPDPVVQPPLFFFPFLAGFLGAPPSLVPSTAPHAAPVSLCPTTLGPGARSRATRDPDTLSRVARGLDATSYATRGPYTLFRVTCGPNTLFCTTRGPGASYHTHTRPRHPLLCHVCPPCPCLRHT